MALALGLLALGWNALAAPPAVAQGGSWSSQFDPPGLTGRVFALGTWQGQLVAGGQHLQADGADFDHLALWDGVRWNDVGGGVTNDVRDLVEFEGDLVVAGAFEVVGGTVPQGGVLASGVARWDGTQWHPFGVGLDKAWCCGPEVWALEVWRGELYAAGLFHSSGATPTSRIARWDGSQWQPVGGGLGPDVDATMAYDLTVSEDDRLVVSGNFGTAGGVAVNNIAAWDGTGWDDLGGGLGVWFSDVFAVQSWNGKLYAAGNFGSASGVPVEKVAAWNGTSWEPLGEGVPDWDIGVTNYALEVFGDSLYLGGNFLYVDGTAEWNAMYAPRLARWDGSTWHAVGGVSGGDLTTTVFALEALGDRLYVGGEFTRCGLAPAAGEGAVVSNDMAAFDGSDWFAVGHGLGIDREVYDLVMLDEGLAAVGRFIEAGDAQATRVALFDGHAWQAIGSTNGNVRAALAWQGDLIITGEFTSVDGLATGALARWDGSQWHAMGSGAGGYALGTYQGELYAGGLGGIRRWDGSAWVEFGPQVFGFTQALQEYDGKLFAGGSGLGLAGGPGGDLLAWDGSSWQGFGTGPDDSVEALTVFEGDLVVGGRFFAFDGMPARLMVRYDGTSFTPFDTGITGFSVADFCVFGGALHVSGDLKFGTGDPADYVARWTGTQFVGLGGGGPDGYTFALAADEAAGCLWAGGWFYDADDQPSWNIARWEPGPATQDRAWTWLPGGEAGAQGLPVLVGGGTMEPGQPARLAVRRAAPSAQVVLMGGFSRADVPFLGGVLVPSPDVLVWGLGTNPAGGLTVLTPWSSGIPAGTEVYFQAWVADPSAVAGWSGSNGLAAVMP